jgi:hypothetical protein
LITTGNVVTFELWLPMRLMEPTVPYAVVDEPPGVDDVPEGVMVT